MSRDRISCDQHLGCLTQGIQLERFAGHLRAGLASLDVMEDLRNYSTL